MDLAVISTHGEITLRFNDGAGAFPEPSGLYFVRLSLNGVVVQHRRVVLLD